MLGEEVACAAVSPYLYRLSYEQLLRYPSLWHLHSDFWDFNNQVFHVMKITIPESNPDMGQPTFCFSSDILAGYSIKTPTMTMSSASGRGVICIQVKRN